MAESDTRGARYSWGADEHLFVEISEEMSLEAYFKATAIVNTVREEKLKGILDVCPANASYQVRFDPDLVAPVTLESHLREIETAVGDAHDYELETRIVDIPVLYDDPWTHETMMKFRANHQDPDSTDLEYAARINGFDSPADFIEAHHSSPWIVSMVGFVAGLPFLYQMVERSRQLQVPKYLRPRTDTPALTVGYGGCFTAIYSVQGAGGYQMFGITPVPIYDPAGKLPDFRDFVCFFEPGDIVKFNPISRERYDEIRAEVDAGTVSIRRRDVKFSLDEFTRSPADLNNRLMEALNGD